MEQPREKRMVVIKYWFISKWQYSFNIYPERLLTYILLKNFFCKIVGSSFKLPSVCQCHVLVKVNDVKAINGDSIKMFLKAFLA